MMKTFAISCFLRKVHVARLARTQGFIEVTKNYQCSCFPNYMETMELFNISTECKVLNPHIFTGLTNKIAMLVLSTRKVLSAVGCELGVVDQT